MNTTDVIIIMAIVAFFVLFPLGVFRKSVKFGSSLGIKAAEKIYSKK